MRQVNLLGYAAESARNGVEAQNLWKSGRFSLLLTDCNMPEMDGYELTKAIRALEAATAAATTPSLPAQPMPWAVRQKLASPQVWTTTLSNRWS